MSQTLLLDPLVTVVSKSTRATACYRSPLCHLCLYILRPSQPLTRPFPLTFLGSPLPLSCHATLDQIEKCSRAHQCGSSQTCLRPTFSIPKGRENKLASHTGGLKKKKKKADCNRDDLIPLRSGVVIFIYYFIYF